MTWLIEATSYKSYRCSGSISALKLASWYSTTSEVYKWPHTPLWSQKSVAGTGSRNVTQIMLLYYQVCRPTQLCYIRDTDSWWITFRITASQGDRLSAVSSVIDLPSCDRLISEACFSSFPQHHSLCRLISAPIAKAKSPQSSLAPKPLVSIHST